MSARCWLTRRASRRLCSRDSVLAWFRSGQVTRRPLLPGDLASIFFFLFLIWFSDIESGASNSSFWQSVLTSLEWFSKEQFLFGHWTLDGRFLFRGPKLLTPDLKLTYPRLSIWSLKRSPHFFLSSTLAHCHHVLLELAPIATNKAHRSENGEKVKKISANRKVRITWALSWWQCKSQSSCLPQHSWTSCTASPTWSQWAGLQKFSSWGWQGYAAVKAEKQMRIGRKYLQPSGSM